jgi:hypothetical protein
VGNHHRCQSTHTRALLGGFGRHTSAMSSWVSFHAASNLLQNLEATPVGIWNWAALFFGSV